LIRACRAPETRYPPTVFNDLGGFIFNTMLLGFGLTLVVTVVIILAVVWAVRRSIPSIPTGKNAAIYELRGRFARGEIDPAEFQARMDALNRDS
jgi:uncharacterized membrane protein